MKKIANLKAAGVVPVVVFDGLLLPAKAEEQAERRRYKHNVFFGDNLSCDLSLMLNTFTNYTACTLACRSKAEGKQKAIDCLAAGNELAAEKFFQQALTISSEMVKQVIVVGQGGEEVRIFLSSLWVTNFTTNHLVELSPRQLMYPMYP